jgi:putative membrane protein
MTKSTSWLAIAVGAGSLALVGCQSEGRSDVPPTSSMAASAQPMVMNMSDTMKTNMVLKQLHAINQTEIDTGKLAMDHAQSAEVKKFGNEMMTDHTNLDMKLTDLAKRMSLDLNAPPQGPLEAAAASAADDRKRNLRAATGGRFDVEYIAPQGASHDFTLKLIDEGEKTATGDTKKLLDEAHPIVESHRDHAKNLMRGLTFSATAVGGGPAGSSEANPGASPSPMKKPDAGAAPGGHQMAPSGGDKGPQ